MANYKTRPPAAPETPRRGRPPASAKQEQLAPRRTRQQAAPAHAVAFEPDFGEQPAPRRGRPPASAAPEAPEAPARRTRQTAAAPEAPARRTRQTAAAPEAPARRTRQTAQQQEPAGTAGLGVYVKTIRQSTCNASKTTDAAFTATDGTLIPRSTVTAIVGNTAYHWVVIYAGTVEGIVQKNGFTIYETENGPVTGTDPSMVFVGNVAAGTSTASVDDMPGSERNDEDSIDLSGGDPFGEPAADNDDPDDEPGAETDNDGLFFFWKGRKYTGPTDPETGKPLFDQEGYYVGPVKEDSTPMYNHLGELNEPDDDGYGIEADDDEEGDPSDDPDDPNYDPEYQPF